MLYFYERRAEPLFQHHSAFVTRYCFSVDSDAVAPAATLPCLTADSINRPRFLIPIEFAASSAPSRPRRTGAPEFSIVSRDSGGWGGGGAGGSGFTWMFRNAVYRVGGSLTEEHLQ